MYGTVITDDGGSHTIDTTGSSSLGWRSGAVTFGAGSVFAVGLATMDAATGPPGRATNVANLITMSVSKVYSGSGISANVWTESVPSAGTMTVAHGDYIAACTQLTTLAGSDLVNTQVSGTNVGINIPSVTSYTGGTYAQSASIPNFVITFSDGHLGWFYGGAVWATNSTNQTWNNTSGTKEYGNYFLMPFPAKIYGLLVNNTMGGNIDFILYSDPLGTPAAEKTVSVDLNTIGGANARRSPILFASPYSSTASQPLAAIMKPTSATNVSSPYKTYNASAHQVTEMCGTNGYAVNRNTGAFAAQNSNKDRFDIGLLVGAFDDGTSAGGFPVLGGPFT
jgi:hypothetical protein